MAPPTTQLYTLSLHDALPIYFNGIIRVPRTVSPSPRKRTVITFWAGLRKPTRQPWARDQPAQNVITDRKSTRLNSSHRCISYAVFCLKKKKNTPTQTTNDLKK